MTCYAVDDDSDTLVRTWAVGHGNRAAIVAALPGDATSPQRLDLAAALGDLSQALWRCYTHPASAAASTEVNTEGWRRQETRDGFETVLAAVADPHQPDEDGLLTVEYDPVQEYAHRVGRALREIGDDRLAKAVAADVQAELRAVESAELGALGGRASQAVVLSRADANPVQVVAADTVLAKDPLGGSELFLELDATAASVAAAHWLKAAADVTAEVTGLPAERVVATADEYEALPFETPTLVLELLETVDSPYRVVVDLVSDAMLVAEGFEPRVAATALDDDEDRDADDGVRLTPLDPSRPARDLLEDLLSGIYACRLLYTEEADGGLGSSADADDDEDGREAGFDARVDEAFCDAVRARAAQDRGRLL